MTAQLSPAIDQSTLSQRITRTATHHGIGGEDLGVLLNAVQRSLDELSCALRSIVIAVDGRELCVRLVPSDRREPTTTLIYRA